MKAFNLLSSATVLLAAVAPSFVNAFSYSGTGCLPGSTSFGGPSDQHAITIFLGNMLASVGPGSSPTDFVKTCMINFNLSCDGSGGKKYNFNVNTRGFMHLESGMTATISAQVVYPDFVSATSSIVYNGFYSDEFNAVHTSLNRQFACGTNMNFQVLVGIVLNKGTSTLEGYVVSDTWDAGLNLI